MYEENNKIIVTGYPWQKSEQIELSPKNLQSNILCDKHNSLLSLLDNEVTNFFQILMQLYNYVNNQNIVELSFRGDLIERWMLKALCGFAVSNNLSDIKRNKVVPKGQLPVAWLKALFGKDVLPSNWGLYFVAQLEKIFEYSKDIKLEPIFIFINGKNIIGGCNISFCGFNFKFIMRNEATPKDNFCIYRPDCIRFYNENGYLILIINLKWNNKSNNNTTTVDMRLFANNLIKK